jgi:hypothetical protein
MATIPFRVAYERGLINQLTAQLAADMTCQGWYQRDVLPPIQPDSVPMRNANVANLQSMAASDVCTATISLLTGLGGDGGLPP